ncbi:MAG: hypothetical protein JSV51_06215 [Candidatus Bathyarchaeota archaeon]|nr:MAG: hypothetical protein JSV51_06215 [Candidatus Bathyarchaeota archaeon]
MPYWIYAGIIICLAWFNIIGVSILTHYLYKGRVQPKILDSEEEVVEGEEQEEIVAAEEEDQQEIEDYIQPVMVTPLTIEKFDVRHPKDLIDSQC